MSDVMLRLSALHAGYGRAHVLHGVDLKVARGEMVALIGANGAGKSTLLKTVVGLVPAFDGSVEYDGEVVTNSTPEKLLAKGLSLVPEGRMLFGSMTVRENLELGAYSAGSARKAAIATGLKRVHSLFPVLEERSGQRAETLSGGEQQMLAVGRALMSAPTLLLLDEPSLGLAPKVIAEIFSVLDTLISEGLTVLLVEQDARLALRHSSRGYVLSTGKVVMSGSSQELLSNDGVARIYLGSVIAEEQDCVGVDRQPSRG